MPVVRFERAAKKVGKRTIVHDLSFDIAAGEVFGFLGPNGAGKTTTVRMMVGLIKISRGDIFIKGHSITKSFKQAIRHVGAIVENPDLYNYLTGYQNLKHYARMVPGVTSDRIEEIAETVGLTGRLHDKTKTYSLGMRQRLGIAQALLHRPSLLILDEPTNGLDPAGIHELRGYLKRLAREEDVAVFVSSHLLSEMESMCDRAGVLQNGKLIRIEKVNDLVRGGDKKLVCLTLDPAQAQQARNLMTASNYEVRSEERPGELRIPLRPDEIPAVSQMLMQAGIRIYGIQMREPSLEDKFLEWTEEKK
ncbi:ABC transporter ATP-binding protein [Saccharibacillus alkalitolerans]